MVKEIEYIFSSAWVRIILESKDFFFFLPSFYSKAWKQRTVGNMEIKWERCEWSLKRHLAACTWYKTIDFTHYQSVCEWYFPSALYKRGLPSVSTHLIPAVFWQPLAYGWNSQVFPQDLVTSRPSVSLIVIPSATNVHLLYTWSLFSFSKCCDGWQSCGRICTFFFFFKEVWRSLIRSWVHWLNRSFAYVQNTFIFA